MNRPSEFTSAPSDDSAMASSKLHDWMQLVRLPNVFTVLADVGAAFLLASGSPAPVGRLALVVSAGVALYWAGMILNDVFDIEKDKAERASRPLASGAISVASANVAGWGLLVLGVLLAAASGYLPSENQPGTWLPAAVAVSLAGMIVAYNGPLKPTTLAPVAMGGCRFLSFLLGASPMLSMADGTPDIPRYVIAIASGFGVYIMGITTIARDEAIGSQRSNLQTGLLVTVFGAVMLAISPGLASAAQQAEWKVAPGGEFFLLIGLIVFPVVMREIRILKDPDPKMIGNTIRAGILTIIPLAAAFAALGAGPGWGLAIFLLVLPAIGFAMRLRVT